MVDDPSVQRKEDELENAMRFLERTAAGEVDRICQLTFQPHKPLKDPSFYESFIIKGVRVDRVERDSMVGSFSVPPRLADSDGNLAVGAIASLIEWMGATVAYVTGVLPWGVSVDMSISYISAAKMNLISLHRFMGWMNWRSSQDFWVGLGWALCWSKCYNAKQDDW